MKNLKIAVFTDCFFPGKGGTEVATYNLCKELINLGNEIVLFAPNYHCEQTFNEFPVYRLKSLGFSKSDKMVFATLEYGRILKIVKEFAPDIVYYCTANGMTKLALKIAKKLNIPTATTVHTKYDQSFYNGTHSHLITNIVINSFVRKLNRTSAVVTVSNDMASCLSRYGYRKECLVIKNGIDHLNTYKKELNNEKLENNLMFCGSIIKIKNIQFSLKCLAKLKQENPEIPFHFYLLGEGNYKKTLIKLAKKLNLSENITFVGYVKDKELLASYYERAKLFLFPSIFDTDGLVVCEASQMGTPALTLEGFGASERITNNVNGFVAQNSVESLTQKLKDILTNKNLYESVQKNVSTIFGETWKEVALKYQKLFVKLIEEKQ